jgi:hypothetical protein
VRVVVLAGSDSFSSVAPTSARCCT